MTDSFQGDRKTQLRAVHLEEAEELAQLLSLKYGIPYINLRITPIDLDALKLIPEAEARRAGVALFERTGKKIRLAVKNPSLPELGEIINKLKQERFLIQLELASLPSLEHTWTRYREIPAETSTVAGIVDVAGERVEEGRESLTTISSVGEAIVRQIRDTDRTRLTSVLETILGGALGVEASDIHLEKNEKDALIRYRLDGVLHDVIKIPQETYKLLLSRIKLVAELKLNIHDRAQDGRFTIRRLSGDIEVRASSLPGPYGESIVLRVLNPKTIALSLEDLGIHPTVFEILIHELQRPNGMIVTTGPTGSGKTTTLYAFLKKILTPDIKIITIENPIEYHLEGVTQTQVDSSGHYSFELGLSAILRQDPDVIMIGEIRNLETARTALNAALTGHLVFSTLHTNNAAGTIPRLIDLGVKPNIIAPAINLAMAQRLVRKLCEVCVKVETASPSERVQIERAISTLPKKIRKPSLKNIKVYRSQGCPSCNGIGYRGRIGIFEALVIDDAIERLIMKTPSEADLKVAAAKQGMLTLYQDAILKSLKGKTSIEEINRVVGEGEM